MRASVLECACPLALFLWLPALTCKDNSAPLSDLCRRRLLSWCMTDQLLRDYVQTGSESAFRELVDRYIAIWNETNAGRRRALIDTTWTEDAAYLDPMMRGDGRAGIYAMIAAVQERFPGHRFRRVGPVD